jgi:hypothetical protein
MFYRRAIYRTIELSDGWNGEVMSTQWLFDVFDASMVVLSVYTILILHPGWLLSQPSPKEKNLPLMGREASYKYYRTKEAGASGSVSLASV